MTVGASTSKGVPESVNKRNDPANQPWIEKYRPQTLDDVAANKDIVGTIKRLTDESRLPHLLLYGPPGESQRHALLCPCRALKAHWLAQLQLNT
jgi:replication factor C subunit 3/5